MKYFTEKKKQMIKTLTMLTLLTMPLFSADFVDENYHEDKFMHCVYLSKKIKDMEKDMDDKYYQMYQDTIDMFHDVNTIETVKKEMLSHYERLRDQEIEERKRILNPCGLEIPNKTKRKVQFS